MGSYFLYSRIAYRQGLSHSLSQSFLQKAFNIYYSWIHHPILYHEHQPNVFLHRFHLPQ
jgi:hypothetical protein